MRKKVYVYLLLSGGIYLLSAYTLKKPGDPTDGEPARPSLEKVFAKINQEVLKNSRVYETLTDATQRIGHRLTGSPNGSKAEEYTHNLLKDYGYSDTQYAPFEVESWMRDTVTLAVVPYKSDNFRDVQVVALAHSPVEAHIQGEIVDLGNGLEGDFAAAKDRLKGKVALVNIGLAAPTKGARNLHRSEKTALAIQHGAIGVIMVNLVPGNVLLTGTASVTGKLISIPSVCVSLESGQEIRQWMHDEKNLHAVIDMTNVSKKIKARNVVATLKGSQFPDEKIIVGGHLDSWDLATGAIDNGIGSFSILDIARTFKALKIKPKRTIEFVMFMGEEQGLLGSRSLVEDLKKTGQLDNVRYILNLDMTNDPSGFNAFGRNEMMPFLTEVGDKIKQIEPAFQNTLSNQAGLHSDHQPFMMEGVPVVGMSGHLDRNVLDCYHANCDRMNLVNKDQLKNTVRYSAMLLYALANADAIPTQRMDDTKTRDFLIAQGLRTSLQIANEWRWKE
ncbi:M20/M25/M40 family metallo-hydrolase [Larkinella rosea]|uniref:Carboxypeptidase Q n=1 Tax=Larkinella rosea TaxID=2025312 RepID=A0A3P1BRQ4_9BACT|nr:M20/M25/M40 family metallo-hydrolase [Larkinella rosea]RRB03752.1 M20/M25/M40 family metallo-hydrolase [Larkinella rosea]